MFNMKKTTAALLVSGAVSASVMILGTSTSAACAYFVQNPTRSGQTVSATGGRSGCTTSVNWVNVYLRKQRTGLPDINIASVSADVPDPINVTRTASTIHVDPLTARTRVTSSTGAQSESGWVSGL